MLQAHKNAFLKVAKELSCQIGLRWPNPYSDRFIGDYGYTAKPQECKAKTADAHGHRWSGLVVSPEVYPNAFREPEKASRRWKEFIDDKTLIGFTFEKIGAYDGLVRYHGKFMHADYDLSYICKTKKDGQVLPTTEQEAAQLFLQVKHLLAWDIDMGMIMHGADFAWYKTGATEGEVVLHFGPNGMVALPTSMQMLVGGFPLIRS